LAFARPPAKTASDDAEYRAAAPSEKMAVRTTAFLVASTVIALPGAAAAGGVDMSATFKALKTCSDCTAAGYGWCPLRRMCGGFANKECGIGPNYVADSASSKASSSAPKPKPKQANKRAKPAGGATNDMSAVFARLRDCGSCVEAGYGWCPNLRKCGGFANKQCGIGERYVSASPPPRNGLWESKKAKAAEAAPTADVPAAPSPPPATLLYAGPASPPPPSKAAVEVSPSGATTMATASAAHLAANATTPLDESELRSMSHEQLVKRVMELQSSVQSQA
jgi:hypothetical protein